ncbi:transporter substrate-binding domain-containing protein [Desulfovibrio mangrovi]|uniref:substrate-binding periplasmic protein n=1 Tax=Desulfovibrio mangrovi TaxID=2976983 RepID=UPI0022455175|nr:transporter substrate-binding domain-containing protein [Desulfovibrio mangrovi]UZP68954.1 transporter substrate-binding domain-containing protein [Desulfovibrio mangrovi]
MKRFLLLLALVQCFCVAVSASAEKLTFVLPEYPPHTYADSASPHGASGLAVEIVEAALDSMGVTYEFKVLPWARGLYMVEQGVVDGVFNLYLTPRREQFFDYCSEVLFNERIFLFSRAGTNIGWNGDFASLKGKRIGVALGFSYGPRVGVAMAAGELASIEFYSMMECVEALLSGKVDAVLSTYEVGYALGEAAGAPEGLVALDPMVESVPSYVAFSKMRKLKHVRDRLDSTLKAMRDRGEIDRMIADFYKRYATER